jgi:hypothetical protein
VNTIVGCQNRYTPKGPQGDIAGKAFAGGLRFDEPAFDVSVSNITPDKAAGIGTWSDADLRRHCRMASSQWRVTRWHCAVGILKENLIPSDLDTIVAYLRSVEPIANRVKDPICKVAVAPKVFLGSETAFSVNHLNDKIKRGFYLAAIGYCMECHTPFGPNGIDYRNAMGRGGREFRGPWGVSRCPKITSHGKAGIGAGQTMRSSRPLRGEFPETVDR